MSPFRKVSALLILAGAASWAPAVATRAAEKSADKTATTKVIDFGDVAISIGWSNHWQLASAAPENMPGTVEFHAADRLQMLTMLTPIGSPGLSADEAMKELVTKSSRQFEGQAVEKEIRIQRISNGEAHGYYVCVTDKAPKPGEYEFLCQGLVAVRDLPINFTLLYNASGKADAGQVLSALKSIEIAGQT